MRFINFFHKHESTLSFPALVLGFIFDFLTLQRVDFILDNLFIILYLVLAGVSILVINLYEVGRWKNKFTEAIYEFLPLVLQFCFGGLFSAFVIFYSKSAYLFTSGAFVLILLTLLVGNEFLKKKYSRLVFQVGVYFVAIFSFSIYFLPVLTRKMGTLIFLYSGVLSLVVIGVFVFIIFTLAKKRYKESGQFLIETVFTLFAFINFLYFTNIIPPIPLSLKHADVYHFIEKQGDGNYLAIGEGDTWREKLNLSQKTHFRSGESIYIFSSIFAPTDLNLKVVHDWQHFNNGEWVSLNQIIFPIQGGRNEGYRGFSKKENIFPGKWRVDIKTEGGQVIGRVQFDVEITDSPVNLQAKII